MFLKTAAQAFEAGDFVKTFWDYETHFLIKFLLIKKPRYILTIILFNFFFVFAFGVTLARFGS